MTTPPKIDHDTWSDIQELPWHIIDRAAARLVETTAQAERARDLAELDRRLDRWAELLTSMAGDARTELLRIILATSPDFDRVWIYNPEKRRQPARAVMFADKVYLAVPDPSQDGKERSDGPDIMTLVVMDRAGILDAAGGLDLASMSPSS